MKYVRFELLHTGKITVTDNGDERVCTNYHGHAMKMKATAPYSLSLGLGGWVSHKFHQPREERSSHQEE